MKTNLFINHLLLFLFLILAACSTGRITISVLEPASISIPSSIQRISLFPGAGIPDPPGVYDSICGMDLKPEYNYNRSKRGYMEGAYEIMSASPRFKKVVLSDSSFENLLTTGVITWDELRQVCMHDSTNAVLLLNKVVSFDSLHYFENVMQYRIINFTNWTFYEPFTEIASEELKIIDTSYFEHHVNLWNIKINSRDVPALLYDACHSSGVNFALRICPMWHDHIPRIIFSGPGESLKQAYFLASHSQWNQAAVIWNDLSYSPNRNKACRASYNLAVTWERDDDLEQAKVWTEYADSLRSTVKTRAYLKILDQRIQLKAELDNQLAGK